MANEGRLRVAVVGAGSWAQRAHIPGWQRDPRVQVVALADVAPEPLAAAAAKYNVERTTTDYRELLENPDIDVIDVVTGNRPHFQVSWDALQAGKHVLCEKPVAQRLPPDPPRRRPGRRQRPQDQARLHVPLRPGRPVRQGADRRRVRRRAVHLQRLRAEQPVARPVHAAPPGRAGHPPGRDRGVVHRGLRRADHRHHALVAGRADDLGRRHHAQLRAQPHPS